MFKGEQFQNQYLGKINPGKDPGPARDRDCLNFCGVDKGINSLLPLCNRHV